jgi:hypothetical protein
MRMERVMSADTNKQTNNTVKETVLYYSIALRKLITISVPQEKLGVLKEFKEIAKREAGSKGFSRTVVKSWEEYNQKHRIGNPQKLLFPVAPTSHELQSTWLDCIFSANDYTYGTDYPLPMCNLRRTHPTFVGVNYQRCQNCSSFKARKREGGCT